MRIAIGSMVVIGGVLLVSGQPSSVMGQTRPASHRVSAIDAAKLYRDACSACHGRFGDGQGKGARLLGTFQPRDFTSGVFKFRTTPTGSLPADEDLFRTISRGVPGTWMPAWEDLLTPERRWALVRYLKGFTELFDEEEPDPAVVIPSEPPSTPESIRRGQFVYAALRCADCHGLLGRGDGPSADELTDDWDRKIVPLDFTRGGYKGGSTSTDLYRTLATGLSGTPMPAFVPDVVAFPGGPDVDVTPMSAGLDAETIDALRSHLAGEPTAQQIAGMSAAERQELADERLWSLVHYVKSLERSRSWFYRTFRENPNLAPPGGAP